MLLGIKDINDEHGHDIGDNALRTMAGILLEEIVNGSIAARVGGDEFALLMPDCPLDQAVVIAERVRRCVELSTKPHLVNRILITN